jgi:hypothetical protein
VVQFLDREGDVHARRRAPAFLDYENFPADLAVHRRRAIYRFVFRTVPDPFMDALDVADGPARAGPQRIDDGRAIARALLNDPLVLHQAGRIADRLQTIDMPEVRIDALFRAVLLRSPSPEELRDGRLRTPSGTAWPPRSISSSTPTSFSTSTDAPLRATPARPTFHALAPPPQTRFSGHALQWLGRDRLRDARGGRRRARRVDDRPRRQAPAPCASSSCS